MWWGLTKAGCAGVMRHLAQPVAGAGGSIRRLPGQYGAPFKVRLPLQRRDRHEPTCPFHSMPFQEQLSDLRDGPKRK